MNKKLYFFLIAWMFISCSTTQKVLIQTTYGDIEVKLYNKTPLHKENFLKLVKNEFYDSLLFHRVIDKFMIQGGDPESKNAKPNAMLGNGDVGYTVPAEFKTPKIFHKKGVIAAAREGDDVNPLKASSGCQFYIVTGKIFTDADLDKIELRKKLQLQKELKDTALVNTKQYMKQYKMTKSQRKTYKSIGGTPHLDGNYTVFGEVVKGMEVVEEISKVKTNAADRPLENVKILKMKMIR